MNISIVGAAGEVGRALALHLLRGGLLGPSDRLQLVGHGHEAGERKLLAERADLLDAFDETAPGIEIAGEPEEVSGDVIAIAGGATAARSIRGTSPSRPNIRSEVEAPCSSWDSSAPPDRER